MYLGSVRFFKHLVMVVIAMFIIIPVTTCIVLATKNQKLSDELELVRTIAEEPLEEPLEKPEVLPMAVPVKTEAKVESTSEVLEYQLEYPDLYAVRPERKPKSEDKLVYLTFDDGPSEQTPQILDILDQYHAKATFFVVYKNDEFSNAMYKEIVDRGHTIGVHSAIHEYKVIYSSVEDYLADFNKMYQHIYNLTGVKVDLFRFPGGSINAYNQSTYQPIIAEMLRRGFTFHDWSVSSGDASTKATEKTIYSTVVENVMKKNKSVVLMHDSINRDLTVNVLPEIIEDIQQAGYLFDKLDATVAPFLFSYKN